MIDNKGRFFGKVSIIDITIVLVLVLSITGILYKFDKSKIAGLFNTDNYEMYFFVEEVPEYVANSINKEDHAKSRSKNIDFGKIIDIKIDKSISWSKNDKGEIIKSTKDGYKSVAITVEGIGVYSKSGLVIDGVDYYIGQKLSVKIKDVVLENMTITGMSKKE